ncbi:tol-pal system-associated acyl-CoA thioesterase [Methylocystis parvus]|uniref:Tol-pal system-associated acyl-CoA thioesterase n=2 Tax=Methylocystis parvus TaxID=134 RepID=A0A6B8MD67_9HYPH|nr:tol-pal system-associated acyl-CoA thioesterase [Methylocystis parvus]
MTAANALPVRVYWEDTDASGLVYHTSYIRFMERGRTELLRSIGLDQRPLLEDPDGAPTFFVVRAMQLDFLRPAVMDDLLNVETRVTALGGASLTLDQRVLRDAETLVTATVKVVCVEAGRAKRLPPDIREKFLRAHAEPATD